MLTRRSFWKTLPALAAAAPVRAAVPPAAAIDRLVEASLAAWGVPGAAVAVVRGGDVLVCRGYGRRDAGRPDPVTADTVFPLASCTKAVTAAVIASLVADGRMGWDDPVRRHLPDFRLSDPHADALVTVRDLLAHRTGVDAHDLLWYHAPWPLDDTLRRVPKLPLVLPFRGGYRYSSVMPLAAGRAAAQAGGKAWEDLARDRVTGPLGMSGVGFRSADVPPAARATGHRRGADGSVAAVPWYDVAEPNPAGSVTLTVRDLAAWLRFLAAGRGPGDAPPPMPHDAVAETMTPHTVVPLDDLGRRLNPDTAVLTYGLGWLVGDHRGRLAAAHGGLIDGFRCYLAVLPRDGVAVGVMCNLETGRMPHALANAVVDLVCGLPLRDWDAAFLKLAKEEAEATAALARPPASPTRPALPPEGYVGVYENPAYGELTVDLDGGRLRLAWGSFRCRLEHLDRETFRLADGFLPGRVGMVGFWATPRGATQAQFLDQLFDRKP